jgi:hypothetical protein
MKYGMDYGQTICLRMYFSKATLSGLIIKSKKMTATVND